MKRPWQVDAKPRLYWHRSPVTKVKHSKKQYDRKDKSWKKEGQ